MRHKSCHLLRLIRLSFDAQSAPNETRSLCARKRKGKNNLLKKNSPRLLLLADLLFAIDAQHNNRRLLQDWHPGCKLNNTTMHESCHLLRLICMSFDEQSAPNETRSLCARKGKKKNIFTKKNSPRLLLLAESSFAIDVQLDKCRSLQDWNPGCSRPVPQGTSLATCFG